jgi:hypothetical protein
MVFLCPKTRDTRVFNDPKTRSVFPPAPCGLLPDAPFMVVGGLAGDGDGGAARDWLAVTSFGGGRESRPASTSIASAPSLAGASPPAPDWQLARTTLSITFFYLW